MFSKKTLRVEIQNREGNFVSGIDTISFKNLPIEAEISLVEMPNTFSANIKIFGVSRENMNYITTLRLKDLTIVEKGIRIYANDGDGEFLLYEGNIQSAEPVYASAPDIYISIKSTAGAFFNMGDIPPSSLPKNAPVPDVFRKICSDFGIGFVNEGVSGNTNNQPYFDQAGLLNRLYAASSQYNVGCNLFNNRVVIFPKGDYLRIWTLNKENYIGYPSFVGEGIGLSLDKLYNMEIGDVFRVVGSDIDYANDNFQINKIVYKVSTKIGGKWMMTIYGTRYVLE